MSSKFEGVTKATNIYAMLSLFAHVIRITFFMRPYPYPYDKLKGVPSTMYLSLGTVDRFMLNAVQSEIRPNPSGAKEVEVDSDSSHTWYKRWRFPAYQFYQSHIDEGQHPQTYT